MPTITGISHIDLSAIDLDRSESFYSNLLDASRVLDGENENTGSIPALYGTPSRCW